MTSKNSFPAALKTVRKARGLSQEAFSDVSSRTYMSSLERGLKSPTLSKVAELCEVMDVHPLTLLTLAYGGDSKGVVKSSSACSASWPPSRPRRKNRRVKGAAQRQRPRDGYVTMRSAAALHAHRR
jgi:transcriptional regulator with XRE-family HTH domain